MSSREKVRNIEESPQFQSERPVAAVITELIDEAKAFVNARLSILIADIRDSASTLKIASLLIAAGLVLCGTAWLVLTAALVALVGTAFIGPFGPFLALAIVGVCYLILGALALGFARSSMRKTELLPKHTLKILKEDREWLQKEAKRPL